MPKTVCAWITGVLDCLGCAGESGSWMPGSFLLSHQGQSSEESSSTPHFRKINDSIFELHGPASAGAAEMEILFFHGLQLEGTSEPHISTWQSRSAQREVWPGQWLPKDFPKNCLLAGVGQRSPVILVGHSFGGLVIKQLCVDAHRKRSDRPEIKTFFQSVKGIFYFATPHHGSHFASAIQKLHSKEGDLLSHVKVFSKELARLNSEFRSIPRQWLVSGLGELLPTKLGREFNDVVVEEASGRCEDFLPVPENHISICQPEARNSTTYQHLSNFIRRVQQKFTGQPHSYPFSTVRGSQTYVPIHIQARDRILSGLENEQGPAVILIHGDPGSGKSVLARFIGESYARSCREDSDSGSIFLSVRCISPKLVVSLECGQTAVSSVLLQKLQGKLHPQVHRSQDQCGNGSMCTLPFLMMGRRIIIVLDDVWNPELIEVFFEEVRACDGAHVKFLVTSRRFDLSDDPEILKVKIEEVTYTEAEKILASHLGLTSIPQNLQKDAKLLVEKSGKHPLALAMVACRITRDRSEDPEQWEAVAKSYSAVLRKQLRAALVKQGKQGIMHYGSVLNCAYRRSIGETLMLTYEDLEPDARYLLLLIAKSGASSVPSNVLRMLFAYGVANHHKCSEPELPSLYHLQNSGTMLRVFKTITEGDVRCKFSTDFGDKQFSYESLGLHDLQKEFLNVLMEEDNERLEKSLVPDSHCSVPREDSGKMTSEELDRATVWILCVLWLRQDLAERAAEKLGVSLPLFGSLSVPILRDALEPLTWLMHEDFGEEMIRCAKQVMVQFFLYGGFDDQSLSRLSTHRDTVSATARMLLRIAHYTCHAGKDCNLLAVPFMDVCSSRTHSPGTVRSLLHFLREKFDENCTIDDCPILCTALPLLGCLASLNVANRRMILADEEFFENMRLYICCSSFGKRFLCNATWPWMYFTSCVNDESSVGSVMTVRETIKRLFKDILTENHFLEDSYQSMLWKLCRNEDNRKLVLLEFPDTVTRLVKLLVNSGDVSLLTGVAGTLEELSVNNADVPWQVRGTPEVISKLLTILSWDSHAHALQHIASGLLSILSIRLENRKALSDTVAQLVKLLVDSGGKLCSKYASMTILSGLSFNNLDVQQQIGGTVGAIPKLVTFLSPGSAPILQVEASYLLSILVKHEENRKALLEVPGTVPRLVKLLVSSGDDSLLCHVSGILITLSWNNPGVARLLSILSGNNLGVQHQAGGTVGMIPKLLKVLSSEDTVAQLVKLFVNGGDDGLLIHFVTILSHVSSNNPDVQYQIGGTAGAIPKLVTLLSSENHPSLQHNASELLLGLAKCQENRKALLELPHTVSQLVKLFVSSSDNCLLCHVLGTLIFLCRNNADDVKHQVGGTAGAIPKLVTVLSSENESLRGYAILFLRIVSLYEENRKALLEVPDTVARLVKLLVNSGDSLILDNVSQILVNLSRNNLDVQHQIGGTSDVQHYIGGISEATRKILTMLNSTSPRLQASACRLLLALWDCEVNRKLLSRTPDAVDELVRLTLSSYNFKHLDELLEMLCYLSKGNPSNQSRIGGTPGAISSLLTILLCVDSSSVRLEVSGLLFTLSSLQANRKLFLERPEGLEELVKLFAASERVELLSNLAGVLNNLLEETPALENQIGEIMSSNPRRRTSRNLYYASGHKKLSLGLRQAMHYEYFLFCLRFGFRARKSLSFPGVSGRWDAVG